MNPLIVISLATSLTVHAPAAGTSTTTPIVGAGTCRCDSGCHHFPDQCTHENDCAPGYVPSCTVRDTDDHLCPWNPSVSCDGECTCVPYFGVDGGDPSGSSSGGGGSSSGSGGSSSGSGGSSSSSGGSSSGGTGSSSGTPGASSSSSSGGSGGGADAGCDCPAGDSCVNGDFCAGPCPSDSWCPQGYECNDGFCVPDCFVIPCPAPSYCDPATGQCVDVSSDGGITVVGPGQNGGLVDAGSSSGGSSSGGSSSGASGSSSGVHVGLDATTGGEGGGNGDGPVGDTHGCGCRAAGTDATTRGLGAIALAALGLTLRRRRR